MSGAAKKGSRKTGDRSLAAKLEKLFVAHTPKGGKRPSYESVARAISESGDKISGPYVWELTTGKADNPKLHHLRALAQYFGVPITYFLDDDVEDTITPQLEALQALKEEGVLGMDIQAGELSPEAIKTLTDMVRLLKGQGSEEPSARQVRNRRSEDGSDG